MLVVYLALVFVAWLVGVLVAGIVYRSRSGLSFGYDRGVGAAWYAVNMAKMLAWPAVLVYWLAKGRPDPKVIPRSQQF